MTSFQMPTSWRPVPAAALSLQYSQRRGNKSVLGTCAVILSIALLAVSHDWKLNKHYFLQPGTWQGKMTSLSKKHPFELVIESAQTGQLAGYMDWVGSSPRYRLAIRGTCERNHIVFEDYKFLERQGTTGLYDTEDVYIIENEMSGTAGRSRSQPG